MPPGSRVAPGSCRATLRSWVSSRVASAYGCGCCSRSRTACTACSVPGGERPSAARTSHCAQTAQVAELAELRPPVDGPGTRLSRTAAATPRSSSASRSRPLQRRRRHRHGEVRQDGERPAGRRCRRGGDRGDLAGGQPVITTSASRPTGAEHRWPGASQRGQRRRAPAGRPSSSWSTSSVAARMSSATSAEQRPCRSGQLTGPRGMRLGPCAAARTGVTLTRSWPASAVDRGDLVGVLLHAPRCASPSATGSARRWPR